MVSFPRNGKYRKLVTGRLISTSAQKRRDNRTGSIFICIKFLDFAGKCSHQEDEEQCTDRSGKDIYANVDGTIRSDLFFLTLIYLDFRMQWQRRLLQALLSWLRESLSALPSQVSGHFANQPILSERRPIHWKQPRLFDFSGKYVCPGFGKLSCFFRCFGYSIKSPPAIAWL